MSGRSTRVLLSLLLRLFYLTGVLGSVRPSNNGPYLLKDLMGNEGPPKNRNKEDSTHTSQAIIEKTLHEAHVDLNLRTSKLNETSPYGDKEIQGVIVDFEGSGKNVSFYGHFDVLNEPTSTFSVCFWMKPFCYSKYVSLVQFDNFEVQFDEGWLVVVVSGRHIPFNLMAELQSWLHICVVNKESEVKMYSDGLPVESLETITFSDRSYFPSLRYVTIGNNSSRNAYCGYLADLKLFLEALTSDQVHSVRIGKIPDRNLQPFDVNIDKITSGDMINISSFLYFEVMKPKHNYTIVAIDSPVNYLQATDMCGGYGETLPVLENEEHRDAIAEYLYEKNPEDDWWVLIANGRRKEELDALCPVMYTKDRISSMFLWRCNKRVETLRCVISKRLFLKLNGDDTEDDNLFAILQDPVLRQISLESTKNMKGSWNNQGFQIQNENNEVKYELLAKNGHIIGRKEWIKTLDETKVNLSLSACDLEEFSCNSGQCIPIEKRCDAQEGDCTDLSDEDSSCIFFYGPPKSYSIFQPPVDPKVALRFQFRYIDIIREDENNIQVLIRLSLRWRDHRLTFYNLRPSSNPPNWLQTEYMKVLWHPVTIIFSASYEANKKMNSDAMIENVRLLPLKRGKFSTRDSFEGLEYRGEDVLIELTRPVEISSRCNFKFTTFPFDAQLCLIPVVLNAFGYPKIDRQQLKIFSDPQKLSIYKMEPLRCRIGVSNATIPRDQVVIAVLIRRRSEGFLLTTLGPCLVLEILGHISFLAFPVDEFYQRASTALSLLIVMASLFSQSVTILPKSASPKAVDVWFFFFTLRFFLFFVAHCLVEFQRTRVKAFSKKYDITNKRTPDFQKGKRNIKISKRLRREFIEQALGFRKRDGAENTRNSWMLESSSTKTFFSPGTVNLSCLAIGIAIDVVFIGLFMYAIRLINSENINEFMKYNDCS